MDEIEELKSAIYSDPALSDPAQEFQRRLQERGMVSDMERVAIRLEV